MKVSCGFLESCNWICVFGFPLFLLFPSTTFLQTTLLFIHSTTTVHTLPHEHAGNAVNDNTLALFLFTTPHHHFTRPSLPSHSPRHSSSLLTHCVQPLPTVSPTTPCKHIWSCDSHTTATILSPNSYFITQWPDVAQCA